MKSKLVLLAFALGLISNNTSNSTSDFDSIRKAVVQIRVYSQNSSAYSPWEIGAISSSGGTGFLISEKSIVTNAHVISNAKYIQVQRYNQTNWFEVDVKFVGDDCDLAILQAKDPKFYEDASILQIGDIPDISSSVMVVGYPIGGSKISVSRGIVSRKEQGVYAHSGIDSHLVIQVDAAINPGNSGGPAIQDGKVVGVAFQSATKGENIGYIIPPNVIRHFLKDVEDGTYDGYVELGIRTQNSFSKDLRKFYGIANSEEGIFVTSIYKGGSAENFLEVGDFLQSINSLKIANNGTVRFDADSRVEFVEIFDNLHLGDVATFSLIRKGKPMEVKLKAKQMQGFNFMRSQYGKKFPYVMAGGLVFQPMSRNLLEEWAKNPGSKKSNQFYYRFYNFIDDGWNSKKEEDVVLYRKLPHPVNEDLDFWIGHVVEKVNGKSIQNFSEFEKEINLGKSNFLRIDFLDVNIPLVLDRKTIEIADKEIRKVYAIE